MKRTIKIGFSAIIALIIVAAVIYIIGPAVFLENISKIKPIWIAILFLAYTVDWLIRGFRWKLILKQNDYHVPVLSATSLSLMGNFSNLIIPAKLGDVVWIYGAKKKHNVSLSVAFTSVLLDRFCDFLAVIIFALISMAFLISLNFPQWVYYLLYSGIGVTLLFLVFIFLIIRSKRLTERIVKIEKLKNAINRISNAFFHSTKNAGSLAFFVLLSLFVWTIETSMGYLVAYALGIKVHFVVILFAIIVANITKTIPLTPADIGVYEGALASILFVSGISFNIGLTIALVDHMIKNIYVLIAGGFATAMQGVNIFKIKKNEIKE